MRKLRLFLLLAAAASAAPVIPSPAVTDGSVTLSAADLAGSPLFQLLLTRNGQTEAYAFHQLDALDSIAIANGRVALFGQLTADAVGPVVLTFGAGGCAPGACYQNLHSYDWLPFRDDEIGFGASGYPAGYETLPVSVGGGVRFTGFTADGLLSGLIRARKIDQAVAGPLFREFAYTWNVGGPAVAAPVVSHMPEPASGLLVAAGAAALVLRRRRG